MAFERPPCECCGETMDDDYCRICEPDIESRPHPQSQSGTHLPYCTKHNRWLVEPTLSDVKKRKAPKPKQYFACGQLVDRATFRSLWLQQQAQRFIEEYEKERPRSRKDLTPEQWNGVLEIDKLIKELAARLHTWAKKEKDVDLADYWKEDEE